jgi:hypothetical protein
MEKITWVPPPAFYGTISFAVLHGMLAACDAGTAMTSKAVTETADASSFRIVILSLLDCFGDD